MRTSLRVLALACIPVLTTGCSWLTDFRQQPSVGTWQSLDVTWADTSTPFRGQPQGSVPITGATIMPWQVSYARLTMATIDSMASIPNPESPTQASVDRGWKLYQINCAVCHGEAGQGAGTVPMLGAPAFTTELTMNRTDGYIWGKIRNGGPIMPSMNRVDETDRWHIVNYVRALQGRLGADIVVRKEPAGLPGVTGEALPGMTRIGPTVPVPFVKPVFVPTPGAGAKHEERR